MPRTILDVSKWQGSIDWDKVKASGKIDGVMLRVLGSKGGKPYLDPYFARNYAECARLGLPVGGYYYTCADRKSTRLNSSHPSSSRMPSSA